MTWRRFERCMARGRLWRSQKQSSDSGGQNPTRQDSGASSLTDTLEWPLHVATMLRGFAEVGEAALMDTQRAGQARQRQNRSRMNPAHPTEDGARRRVPSSDCPFPGSRPHRGSGGSPPPGSSPPKKALRYCTSIVLGRPLVEMGRDVASRLSREHGSIDMT